MSGSSILAFAASITFTIPFEASAIDKEGLLSKYRNKVVVVMEEGISIGVCAAGQLGESPISPNVSTTVRGLGDIKVRNYRDVPNCAVEPLRKGELLRVYHVSFRFGTLLLYIQNVSPHSITRGVGAFAHQSLETGRASVGLRAGDNGKDLDAADALAAHWFKPFDAADDAAKFGNTATGVFVNQVKAGCPSQRSNRPWEFHRPV